MYGAYLMDFSISAVYKDGVVYFPGAPGGPGAMSAPFVYKHGEDGPPLDVMEVSLGTAASTCQRKGRFGAARVISN